MQIKTKSAYEELFTAKIAECNSIDLYTDPETVVMDFEVAALQAVKSTLGRSVRIQGCFFHLYQSTWRKIQELGLTRMYTEN